MSMQRRIGAHVSAAGGLHNAVTKAHDIGCNAVQVFSGSPRIWYKKPVDQVVTKEFYSEKNKYGLSPIITHALYLVNLASDKADSVRKSIDSLTYELTFDAAVQGGGVVVHVGSHQGRGWEASKTQIIESIAEILTNTPDNSRFLIENAAGQNGKIGGNLEEVKELIDELEKKGQWVSKNRLGWCFDTCHAFAAGYYLSDVAPQEGLFAAEKIGRGALSAKQVISDLELWDCLYCIHVNDSRDPFGSGRDRHENLGDGLIPKVDMEHFLNLEQVKKIPLILEVPGIDKEGPDAENVQRLKKIVGE